ncbi:MAG TPA: CHAT domain-containing protein, partial [Burkholderiaceae bacterium]
GLVRARGIEPPGWWRRLEIAYDAAAGTLRYVELTDRARAEETLTRAQTQLVRSFLTQAVAGSAADQDIARTLYEMLLPLRLRDSTQAGRDSVLLLDRQAAAFPWELLEDRWSANTLPPAVAAGMVRQLKTDRFRAVPARAAGLNALVIGNPSLVPGSGDGPAEFADLPGARAEAQAVAQTLQAAGYAVTSEIGGDATSCVIGLHGGAYRVVHLAGHGVIDYVAPGGAEAASGMMVGHGMVLTPADIAQMRWVPALVFLNCCHLGAERSHGAARYHELAANLGSQFIEMGVQAVVAAGWALDDAAAATFAAAFYQGMLSGQPFGAAVRQARLAAYTLHPQVNTWGAYQCYGDPHFSLSAASAQPSAAQPAPPYFATGELLAELDNLLAREAAADLPPVLARVPDMVRGAWVARPEVGQRLARLGWQPQSHP